MIYFLKILQYKIKEMNIAKVISILALLISIGGLSISAWNITISRRSFDHALKVHQNEADKNFEKLRLNFLMQIADDLEIMNKYLIEIYEVKTKFDAEPTSVKESMKDSFSKLNNYTTMVVFSLAKLNVEREIVASYSNKSDYKKLIMDKATFYRDFKTNIVLKESIQNSIDGFSASLQAAEKKNKIYPRMSPGILALKIFSSEVTGTPALDNPIPTK